MVYRSRDVGSRIYSYVPDDQADVAMRMLHNYGYIEHTLHCIATSLYISQPLDVYTDHNATLTT